MKKQLSRRHFLRVAGGAATGAALAACQPKTVIVEGTPQVVEKEVTKVVKEVVTATPVAAKEYTILHWAQSAEPTDPNTQLEEGQTKKVAYQLIADEYKEAHPNVTIEWYRFPAGSNITEWLLARMTAQDAPDIYWANTEYLWPHINKGWALDMTEVMNEANPYVKGNERWMDQFEEIAVISQTGPDGKLYGVNMDGAGVLTVYNKDAFKDAGVDAVPETWGDFKKAWQKLLDAGYIPYGADLSPDTCCFPHWVSAHIYNQLLWDKIYDYDDDGNKVITAKELAVHGQQGDFPEWEAYLKFAHLLKEMVPYFPIGYEGQLDYRQLFRQGKVAMYMEGNWAVANFKKSPPPFDISWLHFPIITKDIWAGAPEKIVRIQGAWGAMQYHVPGYLAEKELDKISVIMDWLMFSSKPENVGAVCKETGLVPLTKGAKGLDELAPFYEPYDRAVPYQSWATLSASGLQAEYSLWQAYLPSDMTDSQFLAAAKEAWEKEVGKILESNPDWKI